MVSVLQLQDLWTLPLQLPDDYERAHTGQMKAPSSTHHSDWRTMRLCVPIDKVLVAVVVG
jgi:hypothetical protein